MQLTDVALPGHYERSGKIAIDGQSVTVRRSNELADPQWDQFLEGTPQGQYQQSSAWAQFKAIDNWKPARILLTAGEEIVGGFQALSRSSRKGKIGYVTKGPVLATRYSAASGHLTQLLKEFAKREKLIALVVQPPDAAGTESSLPESEFPTFILDQIIDGT